MLLATDIISVLSQGFTQALGPEAVVFAIAAIGLNIHFGYTGLLNFGQVGFMLMGAYGIGVGIVILSLNHWVAIAFGILLAAGFAFLLGAPTLKLRADYLAIVTIAAAEILRLIGRSNSMDKITRGAEGLNEWSQPFQDMAPIQSTTKSIPLLLHEDLQITWTKMQWFVVIYGWIAVALLVVLVYFLMKSPWGRVLKSIREDEDAARALGKNVFRFKMQALVLGGIIGGFAGMFQVIGKGTVQPDTFVPQITFLMWTILILGGAARVFSPVVGAIIFWFLLTVAEGLLTMLAETEWIPTSIFRSTQVGDFRFMFVGLSLMLLMIFRPQGIFGDREEMALDDR